MGRILMAWEMGAGYGHLAPLLALAKPLKAAGHAVSFAVRDAVAADAVLGDSGIPYYPAPANFSPATAALHSYPQILLNTALNSDADVQARVRSWQALFERLKPAVLVCDHAPTALLAARGGGIRCIITGNGFVVPPDISPLPELRPWAPAAPEALQRAESQALDILNKVAARLRLPPLRRFADLYQNAEPALFTFQELDPYGDSRPETDYWGPLPGPRGERPQWPPGEGKRVFLYGQPFPDLPQLLEALAAGPHRTLAYLPLLAPELRRLASPYLAFADVMQDMAAIGRECDCALITNGHSTAAAMLLAGKPLVIMPQHLEMLLIARSVELAGAGLAAPGLKRDGILVKLERVLGEEQFRLRAQAVAARYRGWEAMRPVQLFEALVTRLLEH